MTQSWKRSENSSIADPDVFVYGNGFSFSQEIVAGPQRFGSDEPVSDGGGGTGPTPYDLLLGALGACTSMTLGMYARRRDWPLKEIVVRLRYSKVHAEECAECETKTGALERIEREIEFAGPPDSRAANEVTRNRGEVPRLPNTEIRNQHSHLARISEFPLRSHCSARFAMARQACHPFFKVNVPPVTIAPISIRRVGCPAPTDQKNRASPCPHAEQVILVS
jgi:uncharacterized OsmC-like protein